MIDTHAHLTDELLLPRQSEIIKNFNNDNLDFVFTVGTTIQSSKEALNLAINNEKVYAIVGVHPDDISTYKREDLEALLSHPKVLAVGEIGLDYHTTKDNKEHQKQVFLDQIKLAYKYKLPIVIHSRDAVGDTLDILRTNKEYLKYGGVWHCFNESVEVLQEIKKLGLIVSLGGVTTFKNAKNSIFVIKALGDDDFVLETDCPYLTPEPFRGRCVNEPKFVRYTAEHIADIRQVNVSKIYECTTKNVYRVFKKLKVNNE